MSGPDAVSKLRGVGYSGLIIGVTGNALEEQIQEFIRHGVNDVVVKPVDIHKLMTIITEFKSVDNV